MKVGRRFIEWHVGMDEVSEEGMKVGRGTVGRHEGTEGVCGVE